MVGVHRDILVVEDDPNDEALTLRALRANHIENRVHVVRDGAEALDFLLCQGAYAHRQPDDLPQVVLLDLRLPKIDGLQVLKRVRQEATLQGLPVVVLTSSDEESDMVRSYRLGANSFVRKPVVFSEFINAVTQLGLYWVLINRAPARTIPGL